MQPIGQRSPEMKPLMREERTISKTRIQYRMYRLDGVAGAYYAVELATDTEADMQVIGTSQNRAEKVFEVLVNETVTPCTLRDILHDLDTEEEERRYRRNLCRT